MLNKSQSYEKNVRLAKQQLLDFLKSGKSLTLSAKHIDALKKHQERDIEANAIHQLESFILSLQKKEPYAMVSASQYTPFLTEVAQKGSLAELLPLAAKTIASSEIAKKAVAKRILTDAIDNQPKVKRSNEYYEGRELSKKEVRTYLKNKDESFYQKIKKLPFDEMLEAALNHIASDKDFNASDKDFNALVRDQLTKNFSIWKGETLSTIKEALKDKDEATQEQAINNIFGSQEKLNQAASNHFMQSVFASALGAQDVEPFNQVQYLSSDGTPLPLNPEDLSFTVVYPLAQQLTNTKVLIPIEDIESFFKLPKDAQEEALKQINEEILKQGKTQGIFKEIETSAPGIGNSGYNIKHEKYAINLDITPDLAKNPLALSQTLKLFSTESGDFGAIAQKIISDKVQSAVKSKNDNLAKIETLKALLPELENLKRFHGEDSFSIQKKKSFGVGFWQAGALSKIKIKISPESTISIKESKGLLTVKEKTNGIEKSAILKAKEILDLITQNYHAAHDLTIKKKSTITAKR